jgi:acyl-coenzyme A thioesterase PaaI-like protein
MSSPQPDHPILRQWEKLQGRPGGKRLFSWMIGRHARYTGTIGARVVELEPGSAKVRMRDRPGLRNHLQSIHAVALANLGELATGLAMTVAIPPHARGIPTRLTLEYIKKARGEITAEARCERPDGREPQTYEARADLTDAAGEVVARAVAEWLVGPKP